MLFGNEFGELQLNFDIARKDEDGELVTMKFVHFLENYSSDGSIKDYKFQFETLSESSVPTIYVDFEQVTTFDIDLATFIVKDYYRFEPCLRRAIQSVHMKHHTPLQSQQIQSEEYSVAFYNTGPHYKLRDLKTHLIGKLTSVCATVTRTSEVRPELLFGSFRCTDCNYIFNDVEQQFKYTEPVKCPTTNCQNTNRWMLIPERSKFVDWQKVRVQENANEIPSGSMPRSMDIILRQAAVEKAKAGDRCIFTGMLIVVPDVSALRLPGAAVTAVRDFSKVTGVPSQPGQGVTGLTELGVRDLTYKMVFLAQTVQGAVDKSAVNIRQDMDSEESVSQFSEQEKKDIFMMKSDRNLYKNLVASFAPAIYGHEDVKRGILLMLFGGVHKVTPEGINLRGDINVCLVGDPSVAKSQFLKYVSGIIPRSVYTSGKASSAAGLTASVVRDSETGEFNFEAGALLLADNGIACIDEFDKMEPTDQVAIHEAMEQQTISIAKAGIQATLNARTAILAAANPIGGRYDRLKDFKGNVNITPAIMSRFDLLFVLLDENQEEVDTRLARHVVLVHQKKDEAIRPPYKTSQLQRYIRFAKTIKPKLTEEAQKCLVLEYQNLRRADMVSGRKHQPFRITVRQLESVIRLAEALARLHLDTEIHQTYVSEAARLVRKSLIHIDSQDIILETTNIPGRFDLNMDVGENQTTGNQETPKKKNPRKKNQSPPSSKPKSPETDKMDVVQEKSAEPAKAAVKLSKQKFSIMMTHILEELKERQKQSPNQFSGLKQSQIVNWYIEKHVKVSSEEELVKETRIVRAVVKSMYQKERVLLCLVKDDDPLLIPAPNYK